MVAASVLNGHVSVQVNGNVVAPNAPANFVVPVSPADVANYIRQGNNLLIELKTGQTFTIQGFAQQGFVNNIVLSAGGANTLTEGAIIENLRNWLGPRTLIVATHRYQVLNLVDRIILVDGGRIVQDGPKAQILAMLSGQNGPQQQGAAASGKLKN